MADVYTLVDPITVDGVVISAVTMPKVKGKLIRTIGQITDRIEKGDLSEIDGAAEMIEQVFNLPPGAFDEMCLEDIEALQDRFEILNPQKAPTK